MKVIFTQEVVGVAKRNEIKEVADGYALNYLLPRGLAVRLTAERLQAVMAKQQADSKAQTQALALAYGLAGQLKNKSVTMVRSTASTGTLYAAITPEAVAQALIEQLKIRLLPEQIIVPAHVKTVGDYNIQVNLHPQVKITMILHVVSK
jgi:large subunit ribosomal protein L9